MTIIKIQKKLDKFLKEGSEIFDQLDDKLYYSNNYWERKDLLKLKALFQGSISDTKELIDETLEDSIIKL